jgi:hypothetical protein
MSYLHHVFISYRRGSLVQQWLRRFLPLFKGWLGEELGEEAKVFVDKNSVETGERWPHAIREGLLHSRCLVPIWSPYYFNSAWCLSEWRTFQARGANLVVPVLFHGPKSLPADAREIQMEDFSPYTSTSLGFKKSPEFSKFEMATKGFALRVGEVIRRAPTFDPTWKVVEDHPSDPDPTIPVSTLA